MKYRLKKDIIVEGQLIKGGSIITINEEVVEPTITWGEVKQIFNAISKNNDRATLGNTMKTIGKVGLKIGLSSFGLGIVAEAIASAIDATGDINDIKSAGKALFKVSSTISKMELNDPNNSKFKELTGPFWRAIKLSPELSQILDDKIELAFINEVILPKIQQAGNDNDIIPNMDLELGKWLNDKGLKTRAGIHFKGRSDLIKL